MQINLLRVGLVLAAICGFGQLARAQNVGIGTTTPTQMLDVNGSLRVRGLAGAAGNPLSIATDGTLQVQAPLFSTAPPATFPVPVILGAVPTGSAPNGVALSPAGTRAYVVNGSSNTLQTFDVSGSGLPVSLGTVPTGSAPFAVSLNRAGTRVYVVNGNSNTLQVFDVSGSGLPVSLSTVPTGIFPKAVALNPAGTRAFVVNSSSSTLQTIDVSGNGLPVSLGTVPTSTFPNGVVVNPAGTRAFVLGASQLEIYDVSGSGLPSLLGTVPTGSAPYAMVVNPAGTRAYVVNALSNTLQVLDMSGSGLPILLGTVPTGRYPRSVALNPAGTRAYVVNSNTEVSSNLGTLQAYDVSGSGLPVSLGTVFTDIYPNGVVVNPTGSRAFVVNINSSTLQVFDLSRGPKPLGVGAGGAVGSLGAQVPGAGRLPVAYGSVGSGGTLFGSTNNFTVTHPATGSYRLSFTASPLSLADLNQTATVATLYGSAPGSVSYRTGLGYLDVFTYGPGGAAADRGFSFSVSLP